MIVGTKINFNDSLQHFPDNLKKARVWLSWKFEPNPKKPKPDKIPYNSNALLNNHEYTKGSSTDPKTWSLLPEALEVARRDPRYGIGIALSDKTAGIVGIDVDNPSPETIERYKKWQTFGEFSPNNGLRLFGYATIPDRSFAKPGLEVYQKIGRFLTITGKCINALPFGNIQAEVDDLIAREFPEPVPVALPVTPRLPVSRDDEAIVKLGLDESSGKFAALWTCDTSDLGEYGLLTGTGEVDRSRVHGIGGRSITGQHPDHFR
jgi:primase-polymerase (primpol)-like protein